MSQPYLKFQVKSSGQYLNILNASQQNGADACQGVNSTTDNFLWQVLPSAGNPGYYLLQVKSSGMYLNICGAGQQNGDKACQGNSPTSANYLWKFVESTDYPGYYLIQVKHSGQYLNILNASQQNGALACQGVNATTPNFLWDVPAKAVTIDLVIDCPNMYAQPEGAVGDSAADSYLDLSDDNRGGKENNHVRSFESQVNPGSRVTWTASTKSGNNSQYDVAIESIDYEPAASDDDLFSTPNEQGRSGRVSATVVPWAPVLASGDNETYSIGFSITPKSPPGPKKMYRLDPKLKVNPAN